MANSNTFNVTALSYKTLMETGTERVAAPHFCIPPYQRQYTWEKSQVLQLLGNVYDYFLEFCESAEGAYAEKFIGAFILVEKEFPKRPPRVVYDVIDGQQRLTTLSLSFAAAVKVLLEINRDISYIRQKMGSESIHESLDKHAVKAIRQIDDRIEKTIRMLCGAASEDVYVPSLYREKEDAVSNDVVRSNLPKSCKFKEMTDKEVEACYGSVPARFFFYVAKIRSKVKDRIPTLDEFSEILSVIERGEEHLKREDKNQSYWNTYKLSYDFLSQIRKRMVYECDVENLPFNDGLGDENQFDPSPMPEDTSKFIDLDPELRSLFDDVEDILGLTDDSDLHVRIRGLMQSAFYVLSYMYFLAGKVSIAVISGNRETALDIFQTMNTAGQPLGCIETFVPEIYQTVADLEKANPTGKNNSYLIRKSTFGILKNRSIEDIVREIQDLFGSNKHREGVPTVVIWFSLICFGRKVGKGFQIQRSELTKSFKQFIGSERSSFKHDCETTWKKIQEFISLLLFVGRWWVLCYGAFFDVDEERNIPLNERLKGDWTFKNGFLPSEAKGNVEESELETLNFCLSFLISAKQTLSVAVVGRYYIQLLKNPSEENLRELIKAAKAVAAFTAIWLSGEKGSTQYAETQRRTMVHQIESDKIKQIPGKLAYFWWPTEESGSPVSVKQLQESFITGYEQRNDKFSLSIWRQILPRSEMAIMRKEINRFLLILYWHCSNSSKFYDDFGIRKYAERASNNFLSGKYWWQLSKLEIEHIVPQEPKEWKKLGFEAKTPDGKTILNQLGNTTLLPKKLNAYASNKTWKYKQILYEVICASDQEDRQKILKKLNAIPTKAKPSELRTIKNQIDELYKNIENVDTFLVNSVRHINGWNKKIIERRTEAIARIIWPLLTEWLGQRQEFDKAALDALLLTKSDDSSTERKKTAQRQVSLSDKVPVTNERLKPFMRVFPYESWTKVGSEELVIDNKDCYLNVRLNDNLLTLEMGKRSKPSIRRAKIEGVQTAVEFQEKNGQDKKCIGRLHVYRGKDVDSDGVLLRILKNRKGILMGEAK